MLTATQAQQQRRRPLPSLKQQYYEYVLQRIEGYKNSLSRPELMELGDEALNEMEGAESGQFLLTELVLSEWVDRLICRRLGLQTYRRWSRHFRQLRAAQREPTHWGIESGCPVKAILRRLEPGDAGLVIGSGAKAAAVACLLAAHEVQVVFAGSDMTFVDQVESRIAVEALSHFCTTFVSPSGQLPDELPHSLQVIAFDTSALDPLQAADRHELIALLQEITSPGGVHLVLPGEAGLAPDAYLSLYGEWVRESRTTRRRSTAGGGRQAGGLLLGKPDTGRLHSPDAIAAG
jgi:hypothetical protein